MGAAIKAGKEKLLPQRSQSSRRKEEGNLSRKNIGTMCGLRVFRGEFYCFIL